jgi:5-methylcytosine-specific restriction endonuclease McrA
MTRWEKIKADPILHAEYLRYVREWMRKSSKDRAPQKKKWRLANREKVLAEKRRYREKRRDELAAKERARYLKTKTNPAKYRNWIDRTSFRSGKRKARLRGAQGSHTFKQWMARVEFYGWHCLYCDKLLTRTTLTKDHRIPISKGGTDFASNIVTACRSCNCGKGNRNYKPWSNVKVA